jgi:hypothetical protein
MAKAAKTNKPVKKISAEKIMRLFYLWTTKTKTLAMANIRYEPPAT